GDCIPASWINWADAAAYLDWAGLRPITELEYEKACRGPLTAVEDEYAWGNADIFTLDYTFINAGLVNEAVSNPSSFYGNSNTWYSNLGGPFRGGGFATASSTRISSGAGYYGAMELTGNLREFV